MKMESKLSKIYVAAPLACLCCVLWGSAFPCIKTGYSLFEIGSGDTAAQILFAGLRFTLSGVLTLIIGSLIERKPLLLARGSVKYAVALSFLQTSLHYMFFYLGIARSTGSKSGIIDSAGIFAVLILSSFVFRNDRLNLQKAIGCAIGFAGIVLVNFDGSDFSFGIGETFIVISALFYSVSSICIKLFSKYENPVTLSGWQFLIGGVTLAVAGFAPGGRLHTVSAKGLALLLYLGVLSAAAYTLWGVLLKHNKVSRISVFSFMTPVCGVLFSAIFLKEQINPLLCLVALLLVSAGIFLVNFKAKE